MEDLITKKELLQKYGISYGALYRWKRMGLIPDAWFIRKSTYTGQETFFERSVICPRIEEIIKNKDSMSLEEIANMFSDKAQGQQESVLEITVKGQTFTYRLADISCARIVRTNGENRSVLELLRRTENFGSERNTDDE